MEWSSKGRPDAHGDEQDEQRHDEGDDEFGSHRLQVVDVFASGSSRWFDLGFGGATARANEDRTWLR